MAAAAGLLTSVFHRHNEHPKRGDPAGDHRQSAKLGDAGASDDGFRPAASTTLLLNCLRQLNDRLDVKRFVLRPFEPDRDRILRTAIGTCCSRLTNTSRLPVDDTERLDAP